MVKPPETIYALSTAPVKSALAVIRISGAKAAGILNTLTHLALPISHQARLRRFYHPKTNELLDEGLALFMPGPNSFTGEDVVELHFHGGINIADSLLEAIDASGEARLAQAGEFSRRAFENGLIDLVKAEAIIDLIDSETDMQRRQALRALGEGGIVFDDWRGQLIKAMAHLELAIDFPDEGDVPEKAEAPALALIDGISSSIAEALDRADNALTLKNGFVIAIMGAPNAGKSSLFNALLKSEAAIVTDQAGTTRDVLEGRLDIEGYPVTLLDTAGLREASDIVEREGIMRALKRAASADMRLWLSCDETFTLSGIDAAIVPQAGDLFVRTHIDLTKDRVTRGEGIAADAPLGVSAYTGKGVDRLLEKLAHQIKQKLSAQPELIVSRHRHKKSLSQALEALQRARHNFYQGPEFVSEDLRLATNALGNITGAIDHEDLLDSIFHDFCIGK